MEAKFHEGAFESVSQRVAYTYLRMLSDFQSIFQEGSKEEEKEEIRGAQSDLHAFFELLYKALFDSPVGFGLSNAKDLFIVADHRKDGPDKTVIKRVFDKQRKMIEDGLAFLSAIGLEGRIVEGAMLLSATSPAMGFLKTKTGQAWVDGLSQMGLQLVAEEEHIRVLHPRFSLMMPALKRLAQSCALAADADLGRLFFARCDFRAVPGDFHVTAEDLFRIFDPPYLAWAQELHAFFTAKNYKAQIEFKRMHQWVIKYQGKKSVKSTPLYQVEFDERLQNRMRAGIKVASAQRVVPLLRYQSEVLQADFSLRSFVCTNCHWCDHQKSLGPLAYEYHGEKKNICWYVNSDVYEFTPASAQLIKEYALMHECLA